MSSREYHLHNGRKGAALGIRVITRARQNEIAEVLSDGTVKVRLIASVADVNSALVKFLAEVLDVPSNSIEIIAGESGRDKLVTILDLDAETVHDRVLKNLV